MIDQVSQAHLPSYYIGGRHAELALAATIFIAVVMVFMKYFGLCSRLHTARRELMACTYQLLLYRRQRRVVMRTQVRTLWCNAKYLLLLMPTILFASVLYLLLHDALANRYAFAPASVGTPLVLRLTPLDDRYDLADVDVRSTGTALPVTAQAHIPGAGEHGAAWIRFEPAQDGHWPVELAGSHTLYVNVGVSSAPAMPRRVLGRVVTDTHYPHRRWLGRSWGWIVLFVAVSFVAAIPLLWILRIRL